MGYWGGSMGAQSSSNSNEQSLPASTPYLSVCACIGYETPYLVEWLEFHRIVGVERFFLYNNADREAQAELLAPYVQEGILTLYEWPDFPPQHSAYSHCLKEHREDSRWIAFIDVDEFLFSPTGSPLREVLVDYEQWPAVVANWVLFGPSGHLTKPAGLVVESYVKRTTAAETIIKSIVDPKRVVDVGTVHWFVYDHGDAVDENHDPVEGPETASPSVSRLRINHYWTKSLAEFEAKLAMRRADTGVYRQDVQEEDLLRTMKQLDQKAEPDDAILRYLPQLRAAVRDRGYFSASTSR
jgi:glycosyl transferase family 92